MKPIKNNLRLFLCGDVMTGRGIDQILAHPSLPRIYESYAKDARDYVFLAENRNGKIHYPVSADYIWGDALTFWQDFHPDIKIVNLETAITKSEDYWPGKGINYRMNPKNIDVLNAAGIDICTLANNHILDWNYTGLIETLATLKNSAIQFSGAGENLTAAMQPAIVQLTPHRRILVFAVGMSSSGVPSIWKATHKSAGLFYIPDMSRTAVELISETIYQYKKPGDLIVLSVHLGSNWGYDVSETFRFFAHSLLDHAGVDVFFGHSSHHPRPIELYHGKPIFYGCGDFINDYEGITGYEQFREDLTLMYFLDFDFASLQFKKMTLIPLQIKKFSLHKASAKDCQWLLETLNQSAEFAIPLTLENHYALSYFLI